MTTELAEFWVTAGSIYQRIKKKGRWNERYMIWHVYQAIGDDRKWRYQIEMRDMHDNHPVTVSADTFKREFELTEANGNKQARKFPVKLGTT